MDWMAENRTVPVDAEESSGLEFGVWTPVLARIVAAAAAVAIVFSIGCAILPSSTETRVEVERSAPDRPDWIVRIPASDRYFYVTGFIAGAESLAEGRNAASLAAVGEVVAYLGLDVRTYFSDRQTQLASEILSLIETSGVAQVRSGRMAELYYEIYREHESGTTTELYDVYVLYRVPTEEIEAERRAILIERSRALRSAEEAINLATDEALTRNIVAVLESLATAYRHLAHLEPSSETMHRIEGRLAQLAAQVSLTLEVQRPSDPKSVRYLKLRGQAFLLRPSGSVPLRGVPLMFAVEGSARTVNANGVTNEEGIAEVTVALSEQPQDVARLRLHPSMFSFVLAAEETREELTVLLSPMQTVSVELPIQIGGSAVSVRPFLTTDRPFKGEGDDGPVHIMLGRQVASPGVEKVSYPILVRLTAPSGSKPSRQPLNIGLILDTSGSMRAPQKIDYVKEAAMTLVRYLGPRDTLSIVTYNTEARILLPAAPFAGRATLLHVLEGLEAGGRTNVSDGVETALRQIRPYVRADRTSRLILLTDGLANEGIIGSEGLARLAAEARRLGAPLSTIGLGSDFDSQLLRGMAENGGGRYYYAASADELPEILAREVEGLLAQSMGEITIEFDLTPDAGVQNTFGYPMHSRKGTYVIPVGALTEGNSRTVAVELVGNCASGQLAPLGTATVQYRDRAGGGQWRRISEQLSLRCSFEHSSPTPQDGSLVGVYMKLMRALDRLDLALSSGDEDLAQALPAFLRQELPSIRAIATALQDQQLLDLVSLFDHGMEEITEWSEGIHHHEAGEEVDIKRDAAYRIYLLRHHGEGHRLLRPDF